MKSQIFLKARIIAICDLLTFTNCLKDVLLVAPLTDAYLAVFISYELKHKISIMGLEFDYYRRVLGKS
jgi:hypothetical protein